MAKFNIVCPRCGSHNRASTFILAKKAIKCGTCGEEIDVKASRLISKLCPSCGNVYVCDQAKIKGMKCPICGKSAAALSATTKYKIAKISCPQCECEIEIDSTKPLATCPICDKSIDVIAELAKAKLVTDTGVSIIKYEGDNSTFVWKHPIEDFNLGSQLIVHESQEAIFFLNGEALDTFGPGRHTLETENLPFLKKIYTLPTGKSTPFHAEVYFINKTVQMSLKWGTDSQVRFLDPEYGVPLEIGASGEMNLMVEDSRKLLIKLVGTMRGIAWDDQDEFSKSLRSCFRPLISTTVKANLAQSIIQNKIDILEVDIHLLELSETLRQNILPGFSEYGLDIPQFYITTVLLPDEKDRNFREIRALHEVRLRKKVIEVQADVGTAEEQAKRTVELEKQTTMTEVEKRKAERDIIRAQVGAEELRVTGFAEAQVMREKGYTQKDVLEAEVQKAYAEGIGNMGGSEGGGGSGSGIVSDIVGIVAGMKAAGVMSDKLNFASGLGGIPTQPAPIAPTTPPAAPLSEGWNCSCGERGISSKFCPECGKPKPAPTEGWICSVCGARGITSRFCPECGAKRPETGETWNCPECGAKSLTSKCCPECGTKRPAGGETWNCPECGAKSLITKCCPECGTKRP
ncbi:MAG: SPFH domain-containing protein [Clostridia bacterium]|nr:SPFH domain-containing protein [Clostridia bacterium]